MNVKELGPRSEAGSDIIFVGWLSEEKGAFLFAEAATKVGLVPTFVGGGPLAEELALRFPTARLLGWQSEAKVQAIMRAAKALVFPSLWYEGQPLTVLEAKALGVPVIVADQCAGRDEIEDGVTGLWFKSGDVDDLSRALVALADPRIATALGQAAYAAYWADPYTLDRHVAGLEAIYRESLGRRRREAPARSNVMDGRAPSSRLERIAD